jgi:hypothetical protein
VRLRECFESSGRTRRQEVATVKQVQTLDAAVTRKNGVIAELLQEHVQ